MTWSFSLQRVFQQCQRQWFYKAHVANAKDQKDPIRHEAFLLSKLQSVYAWRGQVADLVIKNRIISALRYKRRIDIAEILNYARGVFEDQLEYARGRQFRQPGTTISGAGDSYAALFACEYGSGVSDDEIDIAWRDTRQALCNLCEMSELLKTLSQAHQLIPQRNLSFQLDQVPVTARPDLIAFYSGSPPLIVDWKVHTYGTADYRLQLACYALALTRCNPHKDFPTRFLSPYSPTDLRLLEIQLLTKEQRAYVLDVADVEDLEAFIAESQGQMSLATDSMSEVLLVPSDLPAANDPSTCQRCPFRRLCWESK
ncbi:MAG: PD-(D/E)XK nuclease family protein [Candidatus Marsarchaeota archaeon]|nr:PD-(D/E)XK nuclease family protein [Candidatus Marsarchaeota archaeon]